MVTLAHKLAVESPNIRATCVEASEFMDLSRRYQVTGVPKTIINDTIEILGAVPEERVRPNRRRASCEAQPGMRARASILATH